MVKRQTESGKLLGLSRLRAILSGTKVCASGEEPATPLDISETDADDADAEVIARYRKAIAEAVQSHRRSLA